MSTFDAANWLAILVSLSVITVRLPRLTPSSWTWMVAIIMLLAPFVLVASLPILANLGALLYSLIYMADKARSSSTRRASLRPINIFGVLFLSVLLGLPVIFRSNDGWLSTLGLASRYWFLFSLAALYSEHNSNQKFRAKIALTSLVAALVWKFKIAFAFFISIVATYILVNRSIKGLTSILIGISAIVGITYSFYLDTFMTFLENSVLRPDYNYDTKVLGLSDGARLLIWQHYLENSIWFGPGDYQLPHRVSSHNIFVHLAHELGLVGALTIGPLILYLNVIIVARVGMITALLIFFSLNLSSIGEYASMWVYCIILAPSVIRWPIFRRKVIFFQANRYG